MTRSGNNGLPQSVVPVVDANYVITFVGDTRRPGFIVNKKEDRMKDQLNSSIKDKSFDKERERAY